MCNNAGVAVYGGLEKASHADWEWVLGVNLWGVIHGVEVFVPRLVAQGKGGHIVNTASMAGLVPMQGMGVYVTSKYAVVGLSETLYRDLSAYGIGVTVLCPMLVATRIGQSERNRPPELGSRPGTAPEPVSFVGRVLPPELVARRTLEAIRGGELYVFTHPESREILRRRFARLDRAAQKAAED
ncbi:MAG: hypothetical protein KatS3mg076_0658 [Candidatus Binatia bacterium]|nr:MAG: hypothetical protein KatS3mg076_0658 [Candidatus Binatia bacterium]